MKCSNCYLRLHCDEQTEIICKSNDYCKYMPEQNDKNIIVKKDTIIKKLQDELRYVKRERDAAIADITELAKFYRRRTICDFCEYDVEEECNSQCENNYFINDCFKWRGYNGN